MSVCNVLYLNVFVMEKARETFTFTSNLSVTAMTLGYLGELTPLEYARKRTHRGAVVWPETVLFFSVFFLEVEWLRGDPRTISS